MGFNLSFGWGNSISQPQSVERDAQGNIFYSMFNGSTGFSKITNEQKLNNVLSNPAALKAISLNCDIFSLGKINKYNDGNIETENFLSTLRKKPNFKQDWTQFKWDYKFWLQTYGVSYLWNPNNAKQLSETNPIQWLNPVNIDWDANVLDKLRALIFTNSTFKDVMKASARYNLGGGKFILIPLSDIAPFFDLSNGVNADGNFYKGISRLDALHKVIANSEASLDAKNINIRFSGKFLVAGHQDPKDTSALPLGSAEQQSIEEKANGMKSVHAIKSMVDIKRFIDNMKNLALDEAYTADFLTICSMLNIPKEVSDANIKGSTFENQDKGMLRMIEFGMKPSGQMLTDYFDNQYNLKDVKMDWGHLSCMQSAEVDRAAKVKAQLENIQLAVSLGMDAAKAKQMMEQIQLV